MSDEIKSWTVNITVVMGDTFDVTAVFALPAQAETEAKAAAMGMARIHKLIPPAGGERLRIEDAIAVEAQK